MGKVHFTEEKATMLYALYARAVHSRTADPVLHDPWAEKAVEDIDFDFSTLKLRSIDPLAVSIRARHFDNATLEWIAGNPTSTVLHLGCGLDSRVFRVDPPAGVQWFDVDYPEVIDLRRQLYQEHPGYRMIGSSLLETGWLDEIPRDQPAMVVAEGVMMYIPADQGGPLVARIVDHFLSGRMTFDCVNSWGARMAPVNENLRAAGARFGWGLDDPNEVKQFAPRMELIAELSTPQLPAWERLPLVMRAVVRAMEPFPRLRRLNRILLYRF